MRCLCPWTITIVMSVLGVVGIAHAEYSPPTPFGWRQSLPLELIDNEAVQKDLNLSAGSVDKLKQLREVILTETETELLKTWLGGRFKSLGNMSPLDRSFLRNSLQTNRKAVHEFQKKHQSELDELLSREQQARLHELDLRNVGMRALSDPALADELGLTQDQKQAIESIHRQRHREIVKSLKPTGKPMDEKLLDVLTVDQKAAFEKLKGKSF